MQRTHDTLTIYICHQGDVLVAVLVEVYVLDHTITFELQRLLVAERGIYGGVESCVAKQLLAQYRCNVGIVRLDTCLQTLALIFRVLHRALQRYLATTRHRGIGLCREVVYRAVELARGGDVLCVADIGCGLLREGYVGNVVEQVEYLLGRGIELRDVDIELRAGNIYKTTHPSRACECSAILQCCVCDLSLEVGHRAIHRDCSVVYCGLPPPHRRGKISHIVCRDTAIFDLTHDGHLVNEIFVFGPSVTIEQKVFEVYIARC